MEFQLRNFQTLTEGTKVTLTYELNRYTLKVLQCKPEKGNFYLYTILSSITDSIHLLCVCVCVGISILDADITTDIVEPADLTRYVCMSVSCDGHVIVM